MKPFLHRLLLEYVGCLLEAKGDVNIAMRSLYPDRTERHMQERLSKILPAGDYALSVGWQDQRGIPTRFILSIDRVDEPTYTFEDRFIEKHALAQRVPNGNALARAVEARVTRLLRDNGIIGNNQDQFNFEVSCVIGSQDLVKAFVAARREHKMDGTGAQEDKRSSDDPIAAIQGMKLHPPRAPGIGQLYEHVPTQLYFLAVSYQDDAGLSGLYQYVKELRIARPWRPRGDVQHKTSTKTSARNYVMGTNLTHDAAAERIAKRVEDVTQARWSA